VTDPPAADTVWLAVEIENVHVGATAAASCETVTVWPAIVTVPVRAVPVFAATVIVADPDALAPPATVSHGVSLDDVHVQPLVVVT